MTIGLMLAIDELAASQEAAGDLGSALASAREVNARMWKIHQRQKRQLVSDVWASAGPVRDQPHLQVQAEEASRCAELDAPTGIGKRRPLERFLDEHVGTVKELSVIILDLDHFKTSTTRSGTRCEMRSCNGSPACWPARRDPAERLAPGCHAHRTMAKVA